MKTAVLLLVPMLCLVSRGEDPPPPRENEQTSLLREQYLLAAKKYEFFLDNDHKVPLTLEPKAVFHWSQDNDWNGDVFVWMAKGRPYVLGCMLSAPGKTERRTEHEFHTLSPDPIGSAEMTAKYRWAPKTGIEFKKLDGVPAEKAAGRLTQMRALSRDFTASMQAEGKKWELRLLPQPIFRYQPTEGTVVDGALFTWVWTRGTDPEVVMAIECHRTPKGLEWRYAPLRLTGREVWLTQGDREIWRVPVHREEGKDICTGLYTTRHNGVITIAPEKKGP